MTVTVARNMSVLGLFFGFLQASAVPIAGFTAAYAIPLGLSDATTASMRSFLSGAGCSVAAWMVVYPLDIIKSRAQVHTHNSASPRLSVLYRELYQSGGLRGFYTGLPAGLARSVMANGMGMVVYDYWKNVLSKLV